MGGPLEARIAGAELPHDLRVHLKSCAKLCHSSLFFCFVHNGYLSPRQSVRRADCIGGQGFPRFSLAIEARVGIFMGQTSTQERDLEQFLAKCAT